MNKIEDQIIELFKDNPNKEFSTYDIVTNLYPNISTEIGNSIYSVTDKESKKSAKRKKAQLHRKILYYLNKLVEEDILKVGKLGPKGSKFYKLSLEEGEELILRKKKRKIIIQKPSLPMMPIEGYEEQNLLLKYEPASWIERVNSIIIESPDYDKETLIKNIFSIFSSINDSICLNDFETFLKNNKIDSDKIKELDNECNDYGRFINIILDFTNIDDENTILGFVKEYVSVNPKKIILIFDIRAKELNKWNELFCKIVDIYQKSKKVLYIKNQDIYEAPCFVGKAGPYTLNPEEWNIYKDTLKDKVSCLVISLSTVAVDMQRFLKDYKDFNQFREFILKIAKGFLFANSLQRRKSGEYFENLVKINKAYIEDMFSFGKNYIRFWNYGWKEPDNPHYLELLKNIKDTIDKFCTSEETIYLSCGMPINFKIAFSCAFSSFVKENFSKESFQRLKIEKTEDLHNKKTSRFLEEKEEIIKIFDGGDRLRIKRNNANPKDVCRELNIILNTYKIPFFCYDFKKQEKGDLKLQEFFD
jgi:hypothetical protein